MALATILIVDDSRVSRMLIRAIITQEYPTLTIVEAGNGDELLNKLPELDTTHSFQFATVDLNMPGSIDGLALVTELIKRYPNIKAGLLTANIQDAIRQKAENLGIRFIAKPITEEKILAFIRQ